MALEQAYRSQIEDKAEINTQIDSEDKLKMVIFNLCREIKQIFVIFAASQEFSNEVESAEDKEKWLVITKIGRDMALLKEDEMASFG